MARVHEESRQAASKRALRMLAAWRGGKTYRQIAEEEGLTPGRIREIVSRGKAEAKMRKAPLVNVKK